VADVPDEPTRGTVPARLIVRRKRSPTGARCEGCQDYQERMPGPKLTLPATCFTFSGCRQEECLPERIPECLDLDKYLIVAPDSPLAELVRAAFSIDDDWSSRAEQLRIAAAVVRKDPQIQEWLAKHG
jgi:hypothetical protein